MTEALDVTQSLKDAENSLRDFLADVLSRKLGENWVDACGVSVDRIEQWRQRRADEERRQTPERILYYADFFDLFPILKKHWDGEPKAALGDLRLMEVWLDELGKLRNPEAHRRELMPHQKHLILGIAGDVRSRLIRYQSKMETARDCFPRIEVVRNSVGDLFTGGGIGRSRAVLRPGDVVEFVVTAADPRGEPLMFGMTIQPDHTAPAAWQASNTFTWAPSKVAAPFGVYFWLKSRRPFHARDGYDDILMTAFDVLPRVES